MFVIARPQPLQLDRILERARRLPLSYDPVGLATIRGPQGFRVAENRALIGHGADVFARAVTALQQWRHYELGWVSLYPRNAQVVPGTNVLIVARHLGFWSINACRVVYLLGDGGRLAVGSEVTAAASAAAPAGSDVEPVASEVTPSKSGVDTGRGLSPVAGTVPLSEVGTRSRAARQIAGFAYGTLADHAETGEEIFQVSYDPATDEVAYEIRAVSRERAPLARLGFPIAQALQERFRRDSVSSLRRAVAETAS